MAAKMTISINYTIEVNNINDNITSMINIVGMMHVDGITHILVDKYNFNEIIFEQIPKQIPIQIPKYIDNIVYYIGYGFWNYFYITSLSDDLNGLYQIFIHHLLPSLPSPPT